MGVEPRARRSSRGMDQLVRRQGMKRVAISTMHLYGMGGGARAVAWFARAFTVLGWRVDIFTSTRIPEVVEAWLPRGVGYAGVHPLCGQGYDLLFNIDHFNYPPPLAKANPSVLVPEPWPTPIGPCLIASSVP